ncbi:MAG: protein-glutamate O-methyltransferase CheR [Oscillospiraceae bacterium]|nr:protein-glutamate O-methyltransferase CheR [Oscillospiraceae bacterium]
MVKITDQEFNYIVKYLQSNFGINLSQKRVLMEGRLSGYLLEHGYDNYMQYIKAVEADKSGNELTNLLNKVTTNHTYFMREADHFDFMQKTVLPYLEQNVQGRDLRIWCAASSTGEEPYTLAMILEDYFSRAGGAWDKVLLATDLSMRVLDSAKRGEYLTESIEKVPEVWKKKYFQRIDADRVRVTDRIRSQVVFRRFNLMDPIVAKKPFHVVFCRNVMIYFDAPTKDALCNRFHKAMAPGGFFFVGQTETVAKPTPFEYVKPSIYRKL